MWLVSCHAGAGAVWGGGVIAATMTAVHATA